MEHLREIDSGPFRKGARILARESLRVRPFEILHLALHIKRSSKEFVPCTIALTYILQIPFQKCRIVLLFSSPNHYSRRAGNILRHDLAKEEYEQYRSTLLSIVCRTNRSPRRVSFTNHEQVAKANEYMKSKLGDAAAGAQSGHAKRLSALDIAVYAVTLLEDHPLFNSSHGSIFMRDGTNELEASVMVSKGRKKRCVGVMSLRKCAT